MEFLILTFICVLVITLIFIKKNTKKKTKETQLTGISFITQLKSLITLVQQHRGQTSAWLNGDVKVERKLMEIKSSIQFIIKQLHITSINTNDRWIGFYDHWQRLLLLKNKTSVDNSFDQHCLLIKNLAYLIEDIADNHFLTADYCSELPNIGYTWRELVMSTENIGQSRAIGTSVSVQKKCSSVDNIRLNFLSENINKVTINTLNNLSYLPNEAEQHKKLVNIATNKVKELTETISQELINTTEITLDNKEYFTLATATIASFDNIFDHQVAQLSKVI